MRIIKNLAKTALKISLPVMAGYIVLGIGFGILLQKAGYGIFWSMLMSVFIFAGSMQYVAIDLISGGASLISTALLTLMVNARHLFYGISMIKKYKHTGKFKPYLIFSLTDETYSLVSTDECEGIENRPKYFFLLSLFNQIYWVFGCCLGSIIGTCVPFDTAGIEFSMTALFIVLFVEQWRKNKSHVVAAVGVLSTLSCLLVFGKTSFLIPSMILITVVLLLLRRPLGNGGQTNEQ